jgi:hypothetical protein
MEDSKKEIEKSLKIRIDGSGEFVIGNAKCYEVLGIIDWKLRNLIDARVKLEYALKIKRGLFRGSDHPEVTRLEELIDFINGGGPAGRKLSYEGSGNASTPENEPAGGIKFEE